MKEVFTSETFQTLSDYIDAFMEDHDIYDYDNVTIVIEKVTEQGEDGPDYWWSATLVPKDTASALKEVLVEECGIVDVFWSEDDILGRARGLCDEEGIPCDTLTQEQLNGIKQELSSTHDAKNGLTWESIDCAIRNAFDE